MIRNEAELRFQKLGRDLAESEVGGKKKETKDLQPVILSRVV
jgi:hypothetical protein